MEGEGKRARKRRRRFGGKTASVNKPTSRRTLPDLVDDSALKVLSENNYPPRDNTKELAILNSLPCLLFRRQCGTMMRHPTQQGGFLPTASAVFGSLTHASVGLWQKQVLAKQVQENGCHKSSWRPYATRHVSFVDLGTPYAEALLALDPSGSYMIGVCDDVKRQDMAATTETPAAYLSVRGVPSPATIESASSTSSADEEDESNPSPRLLTIPLDFSSQGVKGRFSKRKILISLCQDWRIGLYLGPVTNTPRDPLAQITVFPLPRALRASDMIVHFYKTAREISFPDVCGSLEGHNLLWEVEVCPRRSDRALEPKWSRQSACLCVFKLASKVRLTWFSEKVASISFRPLEHTEIFNSTGKSLDGLLSECCESIWEVAQSRRLDGSLVNTHDSNSKSSSQRIQKFHEMVLNIELLVHDILRQRPKLAKRYIHDEESKLEFKSEVIDIVQEGRVLNLLITLSAGKAKHPVAVVVAIDLISQTYKELNWMKSTTLFAHIDMRTLCANFRMKLLRCGPFESGKPDKEKSSEAEEGSPGIHYTNNNHEYCFMPLSALYTDTQVVSNSNILCAVPRMSIKSKSPLELVYYCDDYVP